MHPFLGSTPWVTGNELEACCRLYETFQIGREARETKLLGQVNIQYLWQINNYAF